MPSSRLAAPPRRAVLGSSLIVRGLVILIALLALCTAYAAVAADSPAALLCLSATATVVLLLLTVTARRDYDLFEPYSFIILAVVVGTVLKLPYATLFDTWFIRNNILLGQPRDVLMVGSLYVLIGIAALSAGYMVKLPPIDISRMRLVRRQYWERRVLGPVLFVTLTLSVVSFLLWWSKMGVQIATLLDLSQKRFYMVEGAEFQSSLGYLNWGVSVAESAFYVLLAWRLRAGPRYPLLARVSLPVTALIAIAFPVVFSSRMGMVEVLLIALILIHYLGGGIRRSTAIWTTAGAAAAVILITSARGASTTDQVASRLNVEEFANTTFGGRHFLDVAKTSHIISAIPEKVEPTHGATLLKWLAAPIPRTLWPGKPAIGSGPILGPAVFNLRYAGVPPGFVAELYMNFGMLGVPIGMFLVGVFLRTVYGSFRAYGRNPNVVLLYAVTVIPLSFGLMQTELSKNLIAVLTESIPIALLLLLIGRLKPSATTT